MENELSVQLFPHTVYHKDDIGRVKKILLDRGLSVLDVKLDSEGYYTLILQKDESKGITTHEIIAEADYLLRNCLIKRARVDGDWYSFRDNSYSNYGNYVVYSIKYAPVSTVSAALIEASLKSLILTSGCKEHEHGILALENIHESQLLEVMPDLVADLHYYIADGLLSKCEICGENKGVIKKVITTEEPEERKNPDLIVVHKAFSMFCERCTKPESVPCFYEDGTGYCYSNPRRLPEGTFLYCGTDDVNTRVFGSEQDARNCEKDERAYLGPIVFESVKTPTAVVLGYCVHEKRLVRLKRKE